jgi:DNA-directed RNA polymerase subunit RPC12/RpoP
MSPTKYLKGACAHCGGHIEFPAEAAGMTADCPHCGKKTDLLLAPPTEEPTLPRNLIVWTLIAVLVLAGGLGAALYALKRAQKWAEGKKQSVVAQAQNPPTNSVFDNAAPGPNDLVEKAGFKISEAKVEKMTNSSFIYALGTLTNPTEKTRYGVRVQLDLLDASGKKIGTASDYQQVMEPSAKWNFRAPVMEKKAVKAQVTEVTEQ